MTTKHEHRWEVVVCDEATQVKITCLICNTEIWVCPCRDNKVALEGPNGNPKYVTIPK